MLFATLACAPYPEGLRRTPDGDGPIVRVDWDHEPLADIPFPNDLATRTDPQSPTGLRLNVPLAARNGFESEARARLDELSGFGVYSPISVAFSEPLDLENIAARHRDDPSYGTARLDDDAMLVLNVDPDSPGYGEAVELDLGEGRFPMIAADPARYFANDTRFESPSLVFDTVDEDINANGVLDWGEDTDNDGILDAPNVFPEGGEPRADLLTWYERATDTLIARPVVPLREETTYAVILTNRLVGEDGEPVRSPWDYVHHLRQAEALAPLEEVLPEYGLSLDDVAFGWVYTTGRVTGDLVDIRRGLYGEGTLSWLGEDYPAGVTAASAVHELANNPETWRLPVDELLAVLVDVGLFSGESADVISAQYAANADVVVGGSFTTPYLLADSDDGTGWDADEEWTVDAVRGTAKVEAQRVTFTCVLPRNGTAPYPVVLFGHGYGSSRFDFLGFTWAFVQHGWAGCAIDFPGHGPSLSQDDEALVEAVLSSRGLLAFYEHLQDARHRDLNNDGVPDSGGDQWSADAFHTRDMVRQAAVDWIQLVRSFRACGAGKMDLPDGSTATACDWDGDGAADLGGPDARYAIVGGSLGGINAAVAAAVMPEVESVVPIVPGGGLIDVAVGTEIGGAVEAMVGRLISPMFLGRPVGDGTLQVTQMVNSVTDMAEYAVATLPSIPSGGRIVVENLDNGEVREGWIPTDGTFRVSISADALDPGEKAAMLGIPAAGPGIDVYGSPENEGLGDRLEVRVYDATGALVAEIGTFEADVVHEGVTMAAGSPLIALSYGSGYIRAQPDLRRVASVFSAVLEPGDPIAYAPHYVAEPFEALGGVLQNVLVMPTPGDTIVNVGTGIAIARAAGWIGRGAADERFGMSADRFLVERGVVAGLEQWGPYTDVNGASCLFDADDLDGGLDGTGAPSDAPLRITMATERGHVGMRLPYSNSTGQHGFGLPEPSAAFDINTFAINQVAWYVASGGTELVDDACLEDFSCSFFGSSP
jgi:hypothetical protein